MRSPTDTAAYMVKQHGQTAASWASNYTQHFTNLRDQRSATYWQEVLELINEKRTTSCGSEPTASSTKQLKHSRN